MKLKEVSSLLEQIEPAALGTFTADGSSYEPWLQVGTAIVQATHGHCLGFVLYDEWSKRDAHSKYDRRAVESKWAEWKPVQGGAEDRITIGTLRLFAYERRGGQQS